MKFLIIEERFGLFIDESYYKNDSTEDINPEKHGCIKDLGIIMKVSCFYTGLVFGNHPTPPLGVVCNYT
jgi:hypothetical protein